jgi:poly-beta-hydroxybutyrate-responsive repressor
VRRFLEPCLLLLLHEGDSHGYALLDGLNQFGFEDMPVDPSLIYRTLRRLESAGLAESVWDLDSTAGPPRRVYRLTQDGHDYLAAWVSDIRETIRVLQGFVTAYSLHMKEEDGDHHTLDLEEVHEKLSEIPGR